MNYLVTFTNVAKSDLREIFRYVEQHDSAEKADMLVSGIEQAIVALAASPQRGHYPPELITLGIRDLREIHFKPFRIIYSIRERNVIVNSVLDGRRDLNTLLQQRLLL
jgi:toxin ParE1/3/4